MWRFSPRNKSSVLWITFSFPQPPIRTLTYRTTLRDGIGLRVKLNKFKPLLS